MAIAVVIALSGTPGSGMGTNQPAADTHVRCPSGSIPAGAGCIDAKPVFIERCPTARKAVKFYATRIVHWRRKMGAGTTLSSRTGTSRACPRYLAHVLQRRAALARRQFEAWFLLTYEKYRCIHEHEGAWNSNTGNGYWGGVQMDWGFMHTYGPEFIRRWGLAHRWPVWAQLVAAERAFYGFAGYGGRGYSPWGTRGVCGV